MDPPPVVELRVLEGDARTDITFSHNANFFLYTTLESARPIAQGRANALSAPFPVLTGMPVAGMAYLDRPSPAGYFIFPDLSVRHEGKYRLSFNLFEELKEAKDADAEPATNNPDHQNTRLLKSSPMAPQSHVHFRLEVKSEPFVVYSAKKFPGLAESTALSRVVAEQGCRVRIRRDVRMRRRDTKPSKDYDEYDEENAYSRPDRFATPDMYPQQAMSDRARSISNASVDGQVPYNAMEQRRPSVHDTGYYNPNSYQYPPPPALSQPANNNYGSHLSFGGPSVSQYQTPAMPPSNASASQSSQVYVPTGQSYQYPTGPHARPVSNQPGYVYHSSPAYQPPQYQSTPGYEENSDYRPLSEYRRASLSTSQHTYPSQPPSSYPLVNERAGYANQSYHSQTVPPPPPNTTNPINAQTLPPLKTLQPSTEKKYEPSLTTSIMPAPISTSTTQPTYDSTSASRSLYSATSQSSVDNLARSSKRPFAKVFESAHLNQPMHSGMRPDTAAHGQDVSQIQLDDGTLADEEDDFASLKLLSYRRADGSKQHKKCPSPMIG